MNYRKLNNIMFLKEIPFKLRIGYFRDLCLVRVKWVMDIKQGLPHDRNKLLARDLHNRRNHNAP
jgi:hypothetical protein